MIVSEIKTPTRASQLQRRVHLQPRYIWT